MGRGTHCDHDRIPSGREHVRVIIALVVLGELLGEELAGELGTEERVLNLLSLAILNYPCWSSTLPKAWGLAVSSQATAMTRISACIGLS